MSGSSIHRIIQKRLLEWADIPFSKRSSWPRDWTWVSWIAGRYFTIWATCDILLDHVEFTLIHWPNIPGSYSILFFTVLDFSFMTWHIFNCAQFPLCPSCFILSGAFSSCFLLFPESLLEGSNLGSSSSCVISFYLFTLSIGFSHPESWSRSLFPPSVDHIMLELFTMTCWSWVALHGMSHHLIELCKLLHSKRLWSMKGGLLFCHCLIVIAAKFHLCSIFHAFIPVCSLPQKVYSLLFIQLLLTGR